MGICIYPPYSSAGGVNSVGSSNTSVVGSPNEASIKSRLLKGLEQAVHDEGDAKGARKIGRRTFPNVGAEMTSCSKE